MECIYLNNAASSFPKPPTVVQAVDDYLQQPPLHLSRGNSTLVPYSHLQNNCRVVLAQLFNAPVPNRLVFTSGATESLNLVLQGLHLKGKHVVTTCIEHNSVLRVLKTMERQQLIDLSIVPCAEDGKVELEVLDKYLKQETALVVMSHCSNVTGAVNNITAIGQWLAAKDILFVVDASQSAGIYSIDIQTAHIDALCFTGHKALGGLAGIGGLYLSDRMLPTPLKVGGTGSSSDLLYQPTTLPSYYEAGTPNWVGIVSLYEGVQYIQNIGLTTLRNKIHTTIQTIKKALAKYSNIQFYYPDNNASTILSFTIKGISNEDVGYLLAQNFNIIVRTGLHCSPLIHQQIGSAPQGTIRISPSYFTTTGEVDLFIAAMKEIMLITEQH
ncbi:MAG: aminotransferase class V-fold PLP-dependent enzyme [Aureispira sp.]